MPTLAADQTQPAPEETTMNRIQRCLAVLAGLAAALVTCTAAAAAPATRVPPPGTGDPGNQPVPPAVPAVIAGGMPGWQITLIAVGAALAAAALAVLIDRAWAARRRATATAA
jgi:hypothetical protein